MEKKNVFAVYAMAILACMCFFTSCETENFGGSQSAGDLDFYLDRNGEPIGPNYNWTIIMGERTHSVEFKCNGSARLTEDKQDYRILENQRDLNVAYTNSNRVAGETQAVEKNNITHYVTKYDFPMEDGNVAHVNCDIEEKSVIINGKTYALPTDELKDIIILSLSNVDAPATRAAGDLYESEVVYTEVVAELTFETKGLPVNYEYKKQLRDVVTRHIMTEDDIADHKWDESSKKKEWPNDSLEVVSANHYTYWKDGAVDTMRATYTYPRILKAQTYWTAIALSEAQTTGAIAAKLINSQKVTAKLNGGLVTATAYREQRTLSNTVTLNGADSQTNKGTSVEYNNISFEYMGDVIEFGTDELIINDTTAVTAGASDEDFDTFNYVDRMDYKFGDSNTKHLDLPGTIKVEITPFFPKPWGKLLSATETISRDESKKDWTYVWSLHFSNGTLPVIVRKGATAPEWEVNGVKFPYFDSNTDSRFNSGNYIKSQGKWINSIASDEADFMLWTSTDNKSIDNMPYSTAISWNWDNCSTDGRKASVFSNEHQLRVENGRLYSTLGSWK